jgi:RNA polymerase sigma-70 factor (ECF subfamily)
VEVDRTEQRRAVAHFLTALRTGDLQGLMDVIAPDAVFIADGGGVVSAVLQPVEGVKKIVNLLRGFARVATAAVVEPVLVNGAPGARVLLDGTLDTVIGFAIQDGRISRIFAMRNPEKLSRLDEQWSLSRS